ncbi:MAG: hypothetical protein AB7S26_40560 [Sandaracinaceae bacterium]
MSGVVACAMCGSGNAATSAQCWVCGASLSGAARIGPPPRAVRDPSDNLTALGWLALLIGLALAALLIGIELAIEWPGMLVPFALVVLIGFGALARTAWVQTRPAESAPPPAPSAAATPPADAARGDGAPKRSLANDVALGVTIVMLILAGLALAAVAAMVIFFLICLAMIGVGGLH